MTTVRLRVKRDDDPTGNWRDVVSGVDRTLDELHRTVNGGFGLDTGHRWFFAPGERYWRSDVRYESPAAIAEDEEAAFDLGPDREALSDAIDDVDQYGRGSEGRGGGG